MFDISSLSDQAQFNLEITGADPDDDIDKLRSGKFTPESLLAYCLDGVEDADTEAGWREYVAAVVAEAGVRS